ncbi:MAG: glycosyltransferase family 2 protein [Myxococcota bacterium]|nr:glycosyltransferase family 2 protein [Myxococcota bacterium]
MTAAASAPVRISVVAPCFDEAEGIEAVVRTWDALLEREPHRTEIVLCDDGSTDGTPAILARLRRELPRLVVVTLAQNGGYGRALSAAIAASRGEVIVTLDSDGQFDLADGLALVRRLEESGVDCVTGYRRRKADSVLRVAADRGLNRLVRTLFGVDLEDTNCALKAVRGDRLRALRIEARGYPTPTEVVLRLVASGAAVGEAPVGHFPRTAGQSKLRPFRTAWAMARFLFYLRSRLALYRDRIIVEP